MTEVNLEGMRVTLDRPAVVAAGRGRCWFPQLEKFANGELFAAFSIAADEEQYGPVRAYGGCVARSEDGGRTWGAFCPSYFYGGAKTILPDGSLMMLTYGSAFNPPGQARSMAGPYVTFEDGGRQFFLEPEGTQIEGLPQDVPTDHNGTPVFHAASEILPLADGRLLALAFTNFVGDSLASLVALSSGDLGRRWQYLTTVAGPARVPGVREGANESAMARLANGEILCVFRVGSRLPFRKTYSADEGQTWSPPEVMDGPYSVKPALVRLQNGVLALTGGRSGILLWLCTDGHGDRWQAVDIATHHNAVMEAPHSIRLNPERHDPENPEQTTSYTGMVEVEPNQVLILYDRTPFGWRPVPKDSPEISRVYALRVAVDQT